MSILTFFGIIFLIDQIIELICIAGEFLKNKKKENGAPSYKVFINPDGKLFYEDKLSIALVDGIIAIDLDEKHIDLKMGSKYITYKNDETEIK